MHNAYYITIVLFVHILCETFACMMNCLLNFFRNSCLHIYQFVFKNSITSIMYLLHGNSCNFQPANLEKQALFLLVNLSKRRHLVVRGGMKIASRWGSCCDCPDSVIFNFKLVFPNEIYMSKHFHIAA